MARKISVEIVGDASSLERAFKKSSRSAKGFQGDIDKTSRKSRSAFGGIGKMAGFAAGAIGTAGLIGVAKSAFAEFSEGQTVSAQTAAAIKSTGGAANVTAKQVDELANSMLRKTGIDDEAIKTSENMLLTFTNIRNETGKGNKIFDQATGAVADLATAMNKGAVPSADQMQRASIQLGKALNDPIKGVGALARVGIQFTSQQKAQIKTLVKSGKTMEAQKIILAELNKEVGGRAAAAGKTFAGQWRILTETLNNLSGELAAKLMPTIQKYLQMAVKWLNNSKNQQKIIHAVETAAKVLGTTLKTLKTVFDGLAKVVGGNERAIKLLVAAYATFKVAQIAGSVKNLAGTFGLLTAKQKGATGAAGGLKGALGKAGLAAAVGIAAYEITGLILKLTGLDKKLNAVGGKLFDVFGNDPGKQFKGKRILGPGDIKSLRTQAAGLGRRGIVGQAAVSRISQLHPRIARRDIEVAVGLHMAPSGQLVPSIEHQLTKRSTGRPHRRRGAR